MFPARLSHMYKYYTVGFITTCVYMVLPVFFQKGLKALFFFYYLCFFEKARRHLRNQKKKVPIFFLPVFFRRLAGTCETRSFVGRHRERARKRLPTSSKASSKVSSKEGTESESASVSLYIYRRERKRGGRRGLLVKAAYIILHIWSERGGVGWDEDY